jgi:hypothetical protein
LTIPDSIACLPVSASKAVATLASAGRFLLPSERPQRVGDRLAEKDELSTNAFWFSPVGLENKGKDRRWHSGH